jgi:hypothetical protein
MKMMALAVGVWVLGAGSAAALTIDLARPPTPRVTTLEDISMLHTDLPRPVRHLGIERTVLTLQPITIVGHMERPGALTPPQPTVEQLPDITRMHCAEWRDLQMGSGRVQVCE